MRRAGVLLVSLVGSLLLASTASAGTSLAPCGEEAQGALCGFVDVPLDRKAPGAGTIPIAFELHARRNRSAPSLGTVVVVEGGPGGASTELRFFYDLLGPLFDRRDLLLVDVRGTGKSRAIDCPEVQAVLSPTLEMVSACAASLGDASDLYTSPDSADDIDAVRQALGIEKLDFYGVSYGTQVGQVYAVRHGDRLRTLVLDSAYPLTQRTDLFDFDRISGKALLIAVSRLCDRSFLCQKVGGNIDDRMRSLISRVRNQPVRGKSFSPIDGSKVPVTFDETALIEALSGYGFEPGQVEIDGAHAALRRGDAKPILRLGAEAICCFAPPDPTLLSVGDFLAVTCTETSFPWDVADSQDVRLAKWDAAFDAIADALFAPFSVPAWREASRGGFIGLLANPECAAWPAPNRDVPPLVPPNASRTTAPTLVMNGDLDKITPVDAALGVAGGFPNGTFVEFAGVGHGVAGSGPCAFTMIVTFMESMDPGDTSCAAEPPPFYGYTTFPLDAADEVRPGEPCERRSLDRPRPQGRRCDGRHGVRHTRARPGRDMGCGEASSLRSPSSSRSSTRSESASRVRDSSGTSRSRASSSSRSTPATSPARSPSRARAPTAASCASSTRPIRPRPSSCAARSAAGRSPWTFRM